MLCNRNFSFLYHYTNLPPMHCGLVKHILGEMESCHNIIIFVFKTLSTRSHITHFSIAQKKRVGIPEFRVSSRPSLSFMRNVWVICLSPGPFLASGPDFGKAKNEPGRIRLKSWPLLYFLRLAYIQFTTWNPSFQNTKTVHTLKIRIQDFY